MISSNDPNDDRQVDTHDKHDRTLTGVIHSFPRKVLNAVLIAIAIAASVGAFWFTMTAISDAIVAKTGEAIAERQEFLSSKDVVGIYISKQDLIDFVTTEQFVTRADMVTQIQILKDERNAMFKEFNKATEERQTKILDAIQSLK